MLRIIPALFILSALAAGQYPIMTVVDCSRDSIVASIEFEAIGIEPVVWAPKDNRVYATSAYDFWAVDCSTDQIVGREEGRFGIWTEYSYDSLDNKLYCPDTREFFVYDCNQLAVVDTISFHETLWDHVWLSTTNKVYVALSEQQGFSVVDCAADSVTNFIWTPGRPPGNACPVDSGRKLYFSRRSAVGVVDVAAETLLADIDLYYEYYDLLWNPVTNRAYAWCSYRRLYVIDCVGDTVVDSIPCPGTDDWLNSRDNRLYMTDGSDPGILSLDLNSGVYDDTLDGLVLNSLVWDSLDNKLYGILGGCLGFCDTIVVIDCSTFTVIRQIQLPNLSAYGLVWNPAMNKLYVGGDNWQGDVESEASPCRPVPGHPTILRAPDLARFDGRLLDIQGRDVTVQKGALRPGVYFLRQEWSSGPVPQWPSRKVIVTR